MTLLEAHQSFDREFRGNTINPSVMEILARLGLTESVLELRHAKVRRFTFQADGKRETFADFGRLKTPYPYVLMLPQARFLEFVAAEAERHPNFRLVMGAGQGASPRRGPGPWHPLRGKGRPPRGSGDAHGRDGRAVFAVARLAGLEPLRTLPPMDVYWFNLPRKEGDPKDAGAVFRCGRGSLLVLMEHSEYWQVGYIIPKGHYARLKESGLEALRWSVAALAPELAGRRRR